MHPVTCLKDFNFYVTQEKTLKLYTKLLHDTTALKSKSHQKTEEYLSN